MSDSGTVVGLHLASEAEAPMRSVTDAEAVAGRGLRGDRYYEGAGTFSHLTTGGRDLTLTEAEAIDAIDRDYDVDVGFEDHRRNVTTRGIALNHLVGERFRVGDAVCLGVRLCEPCAHLERLTVDGVEPALVHRGGLRADVIEDGVIETGDAVEPL